MALSCPVANGGREQASGQVCEKAYNTHKQRWVFVGIEQLEEDHAMAQPFRGVFTIPSTPFDDRREVDWDGLRRVVDFSVGCGAHGIVWPVNASAFAVLTDTERLRGAEVVIEQTAGRVPVVIGTQGVCTAHAAMFSRHANEIGADAVIAMAPYIQEMTSEEALLDYYRGISDTVDVPVFIQTQERGPVLSAATMARIVAEVEHVDYI